MWSYREHQIEGSKWALKTLREYGLAYLAWKERTNKSGTAILTVEKSIRKSCLIVTKKKAISGWEDHLANLPHTKRYDIINYESIHKMDPKKYDFIIMDESHHAISSVGKRSKTWMQVKRFTIGRPILYLSATPYAEHLGLIYHQLALSDWSPFRSRNFYDFFRMYGVPHMTRTPYGLKETYSRYQDEKILNKISHLFNFKTRQDVGIKHEPTINLVVVKPSEYTSKLMKQWVETGVISVEGEEILADSDMKKRTIHYQIEGSTLKLADRNIYLMAKEKINYIKENYNIDTTVVMAHFIAERDLLNAVIPTLTVLSADGMAEGVDLSMYEKLVIYSMSYRTSKHTQRIARQANHNRDTPIEVDILVMDKPGIGKAIYNSVVVKEVNFTKNSYERSIK